MNLNVLKVGLGVIGTLILASSPVAMANLAWSGKGKITSLVLPADGRFVNVRFSQPIKAGACTNKAYYTLMMPTRDHTRTFSILSTAFVNDLEVSLGVANVEGKCAGTKAPSIERVQMQK